MHSSSCLFRLTSSIFTSDAFHQAEEIYLALSDFGQAMLRRLNALNLDLNLEVVAEKVRAKVALVRSLSDYVINGYPLVAFDFDYDSVAKNVTIRQTIPFEWNSWIQKPEILKLLEPEAAPITDSVLNSRYKILNLVRASQELLRNEHNFIPPFAGHAVVTENGVVHSFDGKVFTVQTSCDYLLAGDFQDNSFFLVGDFRNGKKESVTLIVGDKEVKIKSDLKVTINGRLLGLPEVFENVKIRRDFGAVEIEVVDAARIRCDAELCSVTLSGFLFAKTGGLMGNFDNEKGNEFTTANGIVASNVTHFLSSWQTGECPIEDLQQKDLESDEAFRSLCSQVVDDQSMMSLMPCFDTVDPKAYISICEENSKIFANFPNRVELATCNAAQAYVSLCRLRNEEIWVPSKCVTCQVRRAPFGPLVTRQVGESIRFLGAEIPKAADIVFLVERNPCMNSYQLDGLPKLIEIILDQQGITEKRYAILGIGHDQTDIYSDGSTEVFSNFGFAERVLKRYLLLGTLHVKFSFHNYRCPGFGKEVQLMEQSN